MDTPTLKDWQGKIVTAIQNRMRVTGILRKIANAYSCGDFVFPSLWQVQDESGKTLTFYRDVCHISGDEIWIHDC